MVSEKEILAKFIEHLLEKEPIKKNNRQFRQDYTIFQEFMTGYEEDIVTKIKNNIIFLSKIVQTERSRLRLMFDHCVFRADRMYGKISLQRLYRISVVLNMNFKEFLDLIICDDIQQKLLLR